MAGDRREIELWQIVEPTWILCSGFMDIRWPSISRISWRLWGFSGRQTFSPHCALPTRRSRSVDRGFLGGRSGCRIGQASMVADF
jgi:hypothetical protein